MKDASPKPVLLADYAPPAHLVDRTELTFRLAPRATRVVSRIAFRPNPDVPAGRSLELDGEKLALITAAIDGRPVEGADIADKGLSVPADRLPDGPFVWEAEVEIDPESNTALEGLYMSRGMYCTQCEAQGFRKITYYPDRPDVMAPFSVRIEGEAPTMLSNGNPRASGGGFAEWDDPWPKPSYLFALVAGELVAHSGRFVTASGREIALNVWVRSGDETKCDYALDALRRAMRWDEKVYGREYDLDVFNIVAVDDFNMGAMENKGLNVFNSKYVLASPDTATDRDYEAIEAIVAHEYFHNWTGNRITCRDWFQLCLKEGLTVYRDQQFSGDQRSRAVKRIDDVLQLRDRQFREDAGPLAHPVRPESYLEINNFYTATVYEKGAEVIGMLKRLVGDEGYAKALDLYFERHDGCAATVEDWLEVFEDATGRDLDQFKLWYTQAGTPRLNVEEEWKDGLYTLAFRQETPAGPNRSSEKPKVIPIAVGLLGQDGREIRSTEVLEMTAAEQRFSFEGLAERPIPSILRGFSAPVILDRETSEEERVFLLAHDTDPFNKWEAGRSLAKDALARMIVDGAEAGTEWLDALRQAALDETLDPAFRSLVLRLPSEDDMAQSLFDGGSVPDPTAIRSARDRLTLGLAERLSDVLPSMYETMSVPGTYAPDPKAAGRRGLRQTALSLLSRLDSGAMAVEQFRNADNMTEMVGALVCLLDAGRGEKELADFHDRWSQDRLVMDKWFAMQILHAAPKDAASIAARLAARADFEWRNPNRFRSVIGALAANSAGFHNPDGSAYRFAADWLIRLDPINPQTAARMTTMFETWRRYDKDRQELIRAELRRISETEGLSRDTAEMVGRMLS